METASTRQIVICCDGTNNNLTGRMCDTNVVKLCQLLSDDTKNETLTFYDPGVGNPGELPGATVWDTMTRRAERIAGLAFGRGVYENMAECYQFLMDHYRPGDQIYIFGFSRGAFTARSVAGLINQFGVLHAHMGSMVPTLIHTYFADRGSSETQRKAIAAQTSKLFASTDAQYVEIHFVGVWDTVASVGMWPFSAKFTAIPTIKGKRFRNVRQALALDEHRAQFEPRLYVDNNGTYQTEKGPVATLEQRWFRGVHCDVGGGYGNGDTAISDEALAWLLYEAVACGLRLESDGAVLNTEAAVQSAVALDYSRSTNTMIHSELYGNCLWALTGMNLRDTRHVVLDSGERFDMTPVEHPSVAATKLSFPASTAWRSARTRKWLYLSLVACVVFYVAVGQMLTTQVFANELWTDLAATTARVPEYLQQNIAFARWKTLWLFDGQLSDGYQKFWAPRWALFWDFWLIAAYAYALSWFAAAAFESRASLRRAGDEVSPWLSRLGWAVPLAVFSDVAQNLATLITITLGKNDLIALAALFGIAMSILALLKVVGWVGVVGLCLIPRRAFHVRNRRAGLDEQHV